MEQHLAAMAHESEREDEREEGERKRMEKTIEAEGTVVRVSKHGKRLCFLQVAVEMGEEMGLIMKFPHHSLEMEQGEVERAIKAVRVADRVRFRSTAPEMEKNSGLRVVAKVEILAFNMKDNTGIARKVQTQEFMSSTCTLCALNMEGKLEYVGCEESERRRDAEEVDLKKGRETIEKIIRPEVLAFRDWVLEYATKEVLNEGCGVLDVAGGCGFLSVAFALKDVKSTVIDPRSGHLPRSIRKRLPTAQIRFGKVRQCFCQQSIETKQVMKDLVQNCSVIIGLHPDQAAGEIAAAAKRMNKPFVIVPCCVYSRQFPERFLEPDGVPVRSTAELCQWIKQLNPDSTDIGRIDMQGANTVVYTRNLDSRHREQIGSESEEPAKRAKYF